MSGPWVQTHGGRAWDLLAPSRGMINWHDIASALCIIPRFNGNTLYGRRVSVAQHCMSVADHLDAEGGTSHLVLHGLLHDAHEYVLGDMATPVGHALDAILPGARDAFAELKHRADIAIFTAAGLDLRRVATEKPRVAAADVAVLMAERDACMSKPPKSWGAELEAVKPSRWARVHGLPDHTERKNFLLRLETLQKAVARG